MINRKIVASLVLGLGMFHTAFADDFPTIAFRLTLPDLRSLEPTPGTTPVRTPSTVVVDRASPREPFTLAPGKYACVPFAMVVVAPAPMDAGIVKHPYVSSTVRIVQPPATFVPVRH